MKDEEHIIFDVTDVEGRKGGDDSGGTPRTPTEAPNSLSSNTIATVVDLISSGEVKGLVGGIEGIYLNEVPLYDGGYNFDGVTVSGVNGLPYDSQDYLKGITDETPSETIIGGDQEVTKDGSVPSPQTIDADTDDIRLNLYVQTFQEIDISNNNITNTTAQVRIDIQPDGGAWQDGIKYVTFTGRRDSGRYLRSVRLYALSDYGPGPWLVRITRITADSTSSYLSNKTYWYSYTEIIARKLNYPGSALIGYTVSAREFGSVVPTRAAHYQGILCTIPTGYDPDNATYTDPWDGSMKPLKEYTRNQAWLIYEIATNSTFGLGATLSVSARVELYNISKYNDALVDDGAGGTERRYTFNYQFTKPDAAMRLISDIAASCHASVYYDGESLRFAQDKPTAPSKIVVNSNTIDGLFNYSSSALEHRYNVCRVTWFDMDDFCRPRVEVIENAAGIARYGTIRTIDVTNIGCTSRGQAYRFGNWFLDTSLNQTEMMKYRASFDHADVTPGDVIKQMDYDYAGVQAQEGRLVAATVSGVTIDSPLTMVGGHTYTIDITTTSGVVALGRSLVTNGGAQTELEFTTPIDASLVPQVESVFIITDVDELEPRQWWVISKDKTEKNIFEITTVEYSINKYSRVEDGFQYADPPYTNLPAGVITPPTSLSAVEYMYTEGGQQNHKFGVMLTWNHTTDPRKLYYELQYQETDMDGTYVTLDPQIIEDSWKHQPVVSGANDYRVRAIAATGRSAWETLSDFTIVADPNPIPAISGLTVVSGTDVDTFTGQDCQIAWDAPTAASGTLKNYKLEVYKIDDTLLRTEYLPKDDTRYTYWYGFNQQDNNGTPLRTFKFKVRGINYYDKVGDPGTLVVDNPPPNIVGTPTVTESFKAAKIDWTDITPADNDGKNFIVYLDTSNPPTTVIANLGWETTKYTEYGLDSDIIYYTKNEHFDFFGAGNN